MDIFILIMFNNNTGITFNIEEKVLADVVTCIT